MSEHAALTVLEPIQRPSTADSVFDELHRQTLRLEPQPGTRMSEFDVARAHGVSRQPIRDAFCRLSKLGVLTIRPQRATTVSVISERAVLQGRRIRLSIEVATARVACQTPAEADFQVIEAIIDRQERAGVGFACETAREMKSHTDRVRYLSLSIASERTFQEHKDILATIRAQDEDHAAQMARLHLSRIQDRIVRIRAENAACSADEG